MQRNRMADSKSKQKYLLETAYVNSWLCFRNNIFRSNVPGSDHFSNSEPQYNHKKSKTQNFKQTPLNIFDSRTRMINKVNGKIKHTDMVESQIYIVYHAPCLFLDVFALKGSLVESFDMSMIFSSYCGN